MNTKKMLAILAALSMLGTTGLTVGAEEQSLQRKPKQKQPFRKSQKQEQKPLLWMKQKRKSTKLR